MSLNCSSLTKFYEHRLLSPWLPTLACEPISWLINQLWAPRRAGQVQAGRNVTCSILATCRSWPVVGTIYGTFRHKLSFPVVGTNILRQNIWPWHKLSCPIVGTNITRQNIWPRHRLSLTVVGSNILRQNIRPHLKYWWAPQFPACVRRSCGRSLFVHARCQLWARSRARRCLGLGTSENKLRARCRRKRGDVGCGPASTCSWFSLCKCTRNFDQCHDQ